MAALDALAPSQPAAGIAPKKSTDSIGAALSQHDTATADIGKRYTTGIESEEKKAESLKYPDYKQVPQPVFQSTDPKKQWSSAAMMLAMIASSFTRNPALTAMKAATGVLDAYRQGDQEKANAAFATWKVANENNIKAYEFQTKAYEDVLKGIDRREGLIGAEAAQANRENDAKLSATLHAYGDKLALERLQQEGWLGVQRLNTERQRLSIEQKKAASALELEHQGQLEMQAYNSDPKNKEKPPQQQAEERAAIIRDYMPGMWAQNVENPKVAEKMAEGMITQLQKTWPGASYKSIETYGPVIEAAAAKLSSGQKLTLQDQSALLEAQQRLTTNQAIRGFLVKLNTEHMGLGDKVQTALQGLAQGGPIDAQMAKNIVELVHHTEDTTEKAYAAAIKREMDRAAYFKLDPLTVIPPDVDPAILGGYEGNADNYKPGGSNPHAMPPAGGWPKPDQAKIDILKRDRRANAKQQFDSHYGPGAAEALLGK